MKLYVKLADILNAEHRDCSMCDRSSKVNDSECTAVTVSGKISLALKFKWRDTVT